MNQFPTKHSLRSFIREARRTPGYSIRDFIHGYIYLRWPYFYISFAVGSHPLARFMKPLSVLLEKLLTSRLWNHPLVKTVKSNSQNRERMKISFADTYHGKVVPVDAAEKLVILDKEIQLTNLEKIIPYAKARDIVMKNPDHIVVLDCPCRVARSNPCKPIDVCLVIGEPFASFVAEHHPNRSRWISSEEAVAILRAEHRRGHVHHAFFKDAMLGRFYAICNCCSCCCGAMQAYRHGIPMLASSGYVVHVNVHLCNGCGNCVKFCPFGALSIDREKVLCDQEICMGCGVCVSQCKRGALQLKADLEKGEPLEIQKLLAKN